MCQNNLTPKSYLCNFRGALQNDTSSFPSLRPSFPFLPWEKMSIRLYIFRSRGWNVHSRGWNVRSRGLNIRSRALNGKFSGREGNFSTGSRPIFCSIHEFHISFTRFCTTSTAIHSSSIPKKTGWISLKRIIRHPTTVTSRLFGTYFLKNKATIHINRHLGWGFQVFLNFSAQL